MDRAKSWLSDPVCGDFELAHSDELCDISEATAPDVSCYECNPGVLKLKESLYGELQPWTLEIGRDEPPPLPMTQRKRGSRNGEWTLEGFKPHAPVNTDTQLPQHNGSYRFQHFPHSFEHIDEYRRDITYRTKAQRAALVTFSNTLKSTNDPYRQKLKVLLSAYLDSCCEKKNASKKLVILPNKSNSTNQAPKITPVHSARTEATAHTKYFLNENNQSNNNPLPPNNTRIPVGQSSNNPVPPNTTRLPLGPEYMRLSSMPHHHLTSVGDELHISSLKTTRDINALSNRLQSPTVKCNAYEVTPASSSVKLSGGHSRSSSTSSLRSSVSENRRSLDMTIAPTVSAYGASHANQADNNANESMKNRNSKIYNGSKSYMELYTPKTLLDAMKLHLSPDDKMKYNSRRNKNTLQTKKLGSSYLTQPNTYFHGTRQVHSPGRHHKWTTLHQKVQESLSITARPVSTRD